MKSRIIIFFGCTLILFTYLQFSSPGFPDPDPFFHMRVSNLMKEKINIEDFPWLQNTIHATSYTESSFLYHLIASFLQRLAGPIFIQKLLTVILSFLIILAFFYILRRLNVIAPLFWSTLLIAGSQAFLFRINMARPLSLSIILFIVGCFLYLKNKSPWTIVFLSFVYVWTYNAFPLLIVLGCVVLIVDYFLSKKINGKALLAPILGIIAGIVTHPNFPVNLEFYKIHLFVIPLLNGLASIPVGREWYPLDIGEFIYRNMPIILFWCLGIITLFRMEKKSRREWILLAMSGIFFLLTLKSQRYIEYWVPLAVLFASVALTNFLSSKTEFLKNLKQWNKDYMIGGPLLAVGISISVSLLFNLYIVIQAMQSTTPVSKFKNVSEYLLTHSRSGEVIFNTQWDHFPPLFFWNSKNYYIVGMDPMFMYVQDAKKYWLWRHISDDELLTCDRPDCADNIKATKTIAKTVKEDFNSRFIFLENQRNPNLKKYLDTTAEDFKKVYNDTDTAIYEIL